MYLGYTCRVPPVYLGGGTRRPAANLTSARAPGHLAPGWALGPGDLVAVPLPGRREVNVRSTRGPWQVAGRSMDLADLCECEVPGVNTARNPICVSRRIVPPGRLGCRPRGAGRLPGAASHVGAVRLAAWRRTCDCGPARRSLAGPQCHRTRILIFQCSAGGIVHRDADAGAGVVPGVAWWR